MVKKHQWIHTKQCYQALRELQQDTVPEVSALWKTHEAMGFRIRRHCGDLWFHRGAAIHCHRSPAVSCWILRITQ